MNIYYLKVVNIERTYFFVAFVERRMHLCCVEFSKRAG